MSYLITRRLTAIADEIARSRTELSIMREQLAFQAGVLEERTIEMLVAETPLAGGEHRIASQDHSRVARLVRELEGTIEALTAEQDRLLDRLAESAER
jgi:hypothetical protein